MIRPCTAFSADERQSGKRSFLVILRKGKGMSVSGMEKSEGSRSAAETNRPS
ncbi:MAG: hypothetical protein Q8S57_06000 [Methanoregula sp.]|nr:hypothetical protein [Methanoregula sp.]